MTDLEGRLRALLAPLIELIDPAQRLAWPYLLSALGFASALWWICVRRGGRTSLAAFLFPRWLWLHPSALLDLRFLFARAALAALLMPPTLFSAQEIAVSVALGLVRTLGPGPFAGAFSVRVLFMTALVFVLGDLARFLAHLALHRFRPLWELHKVHHSAEVLTPFTLHRTHPLEAAWMRGASAVALGVATGVSVWMFRGQVRAWELFGIDALSLLWTLLGSNLRHSQVWLSFGPGLERVFLSPAQHQIHHSVDPADHDKNLGEALAIWDWMVGTLALAGARRRLTFGLAPTEQNHQPTVASMLVAPAVAAAKCLVPRGVQ